MNFVNVDVQSARDEALNYLVCVALGGSPVLFDDAFRANARRMWEGKMAADVFGQTLMQTDRLLSWQPLKGQWCIEGATGSLEKIPDYSSNWAVSGALIEREGLALQGRYKLGELIGWKALPRGEVFHDRSAPDEVLGDTALEAAMRALALDKLGPSHPVPQSMASMAQPLKVASSGVAP